MEMSLLKRLIVGAPMSLAQARHERLSKTVALAVFSSDAMSSVAYATEEILLILVLAGTAAAHLTVPIALAITGLLVVVSVSYQQTIHAYPSGGGSYIVARANLGPTAGLVAAGALLIDYVLTVSVSVAAGVAALTSAVPWLLTHRVLLGVAFTAAIAYANLRGVRESGRVFAVPTYLFIVTFGALVATGLFRWLAGSLPAAAAVHEAAATTQTLTWFLVLRAFASGCTALTGIEAISNGVPAFKAPEARNAAITMGWMAAVLGTLFLGVSVLASALGITPLADETVVSQVARRLFGGGLPYYLVQGSTTLILVLAANTSFADFPRLNSLLARDRYAPRQFRTLGDRLVIFAGLDDAILESIPMGASGWVAGLVNALPLESVRLVELARDGRMDEARALYEWFLPLLRLDTVPKFVQLIKLVQAEVGQGSAAVRPPRLELIGTELAEVTALIRERLACRPSLDAPSRPKSGALASSGVA